MKIDHICFAVRNLNDGIAYWSEIFGYKQMTKIVENTRQRVKVTFMIRNDSITVKLIEPLINNQSLLNFVHNGGGFHHICFKCSDLEEKIDELKSKGLKMLVPPQPGEAFNNNNIAFLLARFGINIELIDTDEKSGLL
ncbi:MAG TPA: VOC family protein [Ignavibacteria bacterium]